MWGDDPGPDCRWPREQAGLRTAEKAPVREGARTGEKHPGQVVRVGCMRIAGSSGPPAPGGATAQRDVPACGPHWFDTPPHRKRFGSASRNLSSCKRRDRGVTAVAQGRCRVRSSASFRRSGRRLFFSRSSLPDHEEACSAGGCADRRASSVTGEAICSASRCYTPAPADARRTNQHDSWSRR